MVEASYLALTAEVSAASSCQGRSFARMVGSCVVLHGFKIYWIRKVLRRHWPQMLGRLKIVVPDLLFVAIGSDPAPASEEASRRHAPRHVPPKSGAQQRDGAPQVSSRL